MSFLVLRLYPSLLQIHRDFEYPIENTHKHFSQYCLYLIISSTLQIQKEKTPKK